MNRTGAPDFLLILEEQLSGPILFLKFKDLGMRIILQKNKQIQGESFDIMSLDSLNFF